ncbi:MAG: hypothetical protein IJY08_02950 [Clostridia bacterium]|nr:hypothetical protein [Clostridia bacterium]
MENNQNISIKEKCKRELKLDDDTLRMYAYKVIDEELEKDESERNDKALAMCVALEQELSEGLDIMSNEELLKRYLDVRIRYEAKLEAHKKAERKARRMKVVRAISIIAATVLILIGTLAIMASLEDKNLIEYISDNISKLSAVGDTLEGEVTLTKNGVSKKYSSIEEALNEGELDIMYPSVLPEGVVVNEIVQLNEGDESEYTIALNTESKDFTFTVRNSITVNIDDLTDVTVHEVDGIKYYIQHEGSGYQAICVHNGFEYSIVYKTVEGLTNILDNMRGNE